MGKVMTKADDDDSITALLPLLADAVAESDSKKRAGILAIGRSRWEEIAAAGRDVKQKVASTLTNIIVKRC